MESSPEAPAVEPDGDVPQQGGTSNRPVGGRQHDLPPRSPLAKRCTRDAGPEWLVQASAAQMRDARRQRREDLEAERRGRTGEMLRRGRAASPPSPPDSGAAPPHPPRSRSNSPQRRRSLGPRFAVGRGRIVPDMADLPPATLNSAWVTGAPAADPVLAPPEAAAQAQPELRRGSRSRSHHSRDSRDSSPQVSSSNTSDESTSGSEMPSSADEGSLEVSDSSSESRSRDRRRRRRLRRGQPQPPQRHAARSPHPGEGPAPIQMPDAQEPQPVDAGAADVVAPQAPQKQEPA